MQHVRMSAVQPSRHTVGCGGYLFVGPSLLACCCGAMPQTKHQTQKRHDDGNATDRLSFGSREVPVLLALVGSTLVYAFYVHVASGPAARCLTSALWVMALSLTVRVACRDPGVLPRAWQVTQCPRLSDRVEQLVHRNQATTDVQICSTCRIARPSFASHCSVCDACVAGFDHHCFWLGCCIGERNHADFLLLLYHGVICGSFATVQCAAVVLGPTPHTELVRSSDGGPHSVIMSVLALLTGHLDYIFMQLRFPLDNIFCAILAHPALGYGIIGGLLALSCGFSLVSQLLRLIGFAWLGYTGQMGLCSGTVIILVKAVIFSSLVYFLLGEAWTLNKLVPITAPQSVAVVISILLLGILPMWTAFAWRASILATCNISRKAWLQQTGSRSRVSKANTLISDEEWQKRLRAVRRHDNGDVSFLRRLREFICRTPPASILGQRGGWNAFVRWDPEEIDVANRLASSRIEDLNAASAGGARDGLTPGSSNVASTTVGRAAAAELVWTHDRSMNVYATDGTVVTRAVAPLKIV